MAPLQLGEEIREIHGEALPWFDMHIFATGAGKAASALDDSTSDHRINQPREKWCRDICAKLLS
jgi:hypothetical protein